MLGKGRNHISLYLERTQRPHLASPGLAHLMILRFSSIYKGKDPNSFHFNSMFYYKRTFALVIDNADEGAH